MLLDSCYVLQSFEAVDQSINQSVNQFICREISQTRLQNIVHQIDKTYKAHDEHLQ